MSKLNVTLRKNSSMHTQKYTQPRFWLKYYQAEHFAIISEYIFCHKLLRNTTFLHRINYQICHTKSSSYKNHIKLYVSSMKKLIPRKRFTEKFTANLNMIIYSLIFYIISILISSFLFLLQCISFNITFHVLN